MRWGTGQVLLLTVVRGNRLVLSVIRRIFASGSIWFYFVVSFSFLLWYLN